MAISDVLRTWVRRSWVIAACAGLGAGLAALPDPPDAAAQLDAGYVATATLIDGPDGPDGGTAARELALAAEVADRPEVAELAAGALGELGTDPAALAAPVDTRFDRGAVLVQARSDDPDTAARVAAAFADATVAYLGAEAGTSLAVLGEPSTAPRSAWALPVQRDQRAALGAAAGLLAALLGTALIRPRRHARLRDRDGVEAAYGAPLLAEVPRLRRRAHYPGYVALTARPRGQVAEEFRRLRAAVLSPSRHGAGGALAGTPRVVAVTSPRPKDGRSTVVTNLAAAIAETGRRVIVIDADFAHPTAHFGIAMHPGVGVSDLLGLPAPAVPLAAALQHGDTDGVAVLSIGTRGDRIPGALAAGLPDLLEAARRIADVVVVDAGPLSGAADAVDPLGLADAVLVVSRRGRTPAAVARRAAATLENVGARVCGVALLGSGRERNGPSSYLTSRDGAPPPHPGLPPEHWDSDPASPHPGSHATV